MNGPRFILRTSSRRFASFYRLAEERVLTETDSQMIVSKKYGFLPREIPLATLPPDFPQIELILQSMIVNQPNKSQGLLAQGKLGVFVHNSLPEYDVDKVHDTRTLQALFRDYSFITSAYLLEPCAMSHRETGQYGLGREVLPRNVAVPLCKLAARLAALPFLEYTHHILTNWRLKDPKGGMNPSNVEFIRVFEGGKDEYWFMFIHLYMSEKSGVLVEAMMDVLGAVEKQDRPSFNSALARLAAISSEINSRLNRMWEGFDRRAFDGFRTFLMGIKNQPMFPRGVVYEGVSTEPQTPRGASGANDSIVPCLDNLLEVTGRLPKNELTATLKEFRANRPAEHRDFVNGLEVRAREVGVRSFAEGDSDSTVLYLLNLDRIADFRARHWRLTKHYVLGYSKHKVATGGSPIDTYLPNQLSFVLDMIDEMSQKVRTEKLSPANAELLGNLGRRSTAMRRILRREIEELSADVH